jgi:hypothetical protein
MILLAGHQLRKESPMSKNPKLHAVESQPSQGDAPDKQKQAKNEPTQTAVASQTAAAKEARPKPAKILPTARVSFPKQLDILRAYAAASGPSNKPVTSEEVGGIVKIAGSTVMLANPFFMDVGFLQKIEQKGEAWKFQPSPEVTNFQRAYAWNADTAPHKLAPRLALSWFAQALLPKLSFGPVDEVEAISILAEKAAAAPEYRPNLKLLIDFMEAAGMVERVEGRIRATQMATTPVDTPAATDGTSSGDGQPPNTPEARPTSPQRSSMVSTSFTQPKQGMVNFHVDFKVDMAEMAGWSADRIAAFFHGIAEVLAAKGTVEQGVTRE